MVGGAKDHAERGEYQRFFEFIKISPESERVFLLIGTSLPNRLGCGEACPDVLKQRLAFFPTRGKDRVCLSMQAICRPF